MSKTLTVAWNEYRHIVFTKSFLIGLVFPVLLYGGMVLIIAFVGGTTDLRERRLLVVDQTGELFPVLEREMETYNRSSKVFSDTGKQTGPMFAVEAVEQGERSLEDLEVELSDRVRKDDQAFAFGIIGADYLDVEGGTGDFLSYYSNSPTFAALPNWFERTVQEEVEARRFAAAGLDPREVNRAISHAGIDRYNLAERTADGEVVKPKEENELFSVLVPFVAIMMLFFGVQMVTPVLLNSVIEEKMQRIAEVLISSVTPGQLLGGKLLAGAGIGLTFSGAYSLTGLLALVQFGREDYLPVSFVPYFFIFLLLSLLAFGALFGGISAACSDLKDSQNMAGVVIMLLVIPMVMGMALVGSPESGLARVLSFIPPFSASVMTLRLAIPPGPDAWEPLLAVVLNLAFALFAVFASARVFRIGILAQGKSPSWRELLRWAIKG
ncbi:MAG: ABC transporter permease [Opitutales bacterium]